MDFDKALATLKTGDRVQVSSGQPEPADGQSRRIWRTNNFEGSVVALEPSGIRVELDPLADLDATVAYVIEPGRGHVFFNLTPGLDELKARKLDELKRLRDAHEFGTITVPQGELQIDEQSQGRMARAYQVGVTFEKMERARVATAEAAGEEAEPFQPFVTGWIMKDNSLAPATLAVFDSWTLLMGAHVQHVFANYTALRVALQAADTAEAVEAIDITTGWSMV